MYARTPDADENAQVPACPSWMFVSLAVCTALVAFDFDETFECGAVLFSAVCRWVGSSPRHLEGLSGGDGSWLVVTWIR